MPIISEAAIEKLGLFAPRYRRNLNLSDSSGIDRVANPGKTGSNHLLPSHRETMTLSFAKPDGMGLMPAIDPGRFNWPGFFYVCTDALFKRPESRGWLA